MPNTISSPLVEIARVLVRFDHIANVIGTIFFVAAGRMFQYRSPSFGFTSSR
jgi:hypothetical protein